MRPHSRFAPSAAARWVRCPLSRAMAEAFPDESGPAAVEGTAAHWVAEQTILGRPPAEGSITPNGQEVTAEMLDCAEIYADDVLATVPAPVLEQPVACPSIHPECYGTPDARYTSHDRGALFLWDYKFGHRPVEAFENWQLVCYASGLLDAMGVDGLGDQHTRVVFRIVQPRAYHRGGPVREWSCVASDLRPLINRLHVAAHRDPDGFEVSAECDNCPGRHACKALQYTALTHADTAGRGGLPEVLPPGDAALELRLLQRAAERIRARITGLEGQVEGMIRRGDQVPGFRMAQGTARERWTRPPAEVIALGAMMGVDVAKPAAAITPKQARDAGLSADLVAAYSERPAGALRLVPDDGSFLRRVFGGSGY